MIDFITKSVNSRTITAFFDTREAAQRASDSLVALGVPSHQIQMTEGATDSATTTQPAEMGFWESLKSLFLPAEDHHSYAEGLRRGGFLLSVEADENLYNRALEVLDADSTVNMDEREASWRSSGWTGFKPDVASVAAKTPPLAPGGPPPFDEGAVFARRDDSHGRTRLRSYMYGASLEDERGDERFSTSAGAIEDHMDVFAADGVKIGTVDHLDGQNIKLARSTSPDGEHHYVSLTSVDHVDTHVHLNRTSPEIRASW